MCFRKRKHKAIGKCFFLKNVTNIEYVWMGLEVTSKFNIPVITTNPHPHHTHRRLIHLFLFTPFLYHGIFWRVEIFVNTKTHLKWSKYLFYNFIWRTYLASRCTPWWHWPIWTGCHTAQWHKKNQEMSNQIAWYLLIAARAAGSTFVSDYFQPFFGYYRSFPAIQINVQSLKCSCLDISRCILLL